MNINNQDFFTTQHFSNYSEFYSTNSKMFLLNGLNMNKNPLFDPFKSIADNKQFINTITSLFRFLNFGLSSTSDYLKPENEVFLNFLKMERSTFVLLKNNDALRVEHNLKFKENFLFVESFNSLVEFSMMNILGKTPSSDYCLYPQLQNFSDNHNPNKFSTQIQKLIGSFYSKNKQDIDSTEAISISNYLLAQQSYIDSISMNTTFTKQELINIKEFVDQSEIYFSYLTKHMFKSPLGFISDFKQNEKRGTILRKTKLSVDGDLAISSFLLSGIIDTKKPAFDYDGINDYYLKNHCFEPYEADNFKDFLHNLYVSFYEDSTGFLEKKYKNNSKQPLGFMHQKSFFTSVSDVKIKSLLPLNYFTSVQNQMDLNLISKISKITNAQGLGGNLLTNIENILREAKLELKLNEREFNDFNSYPTSNPKVNYKPRKI